MGAEPARARPEGMSDRLWEAACEAERAAREAAAREPEPEPELDSVLDRETFERLVAGEGPREACVLSYELAEGGRVPPPISIEVLCEPERAPGVARSVARLLESRGWTAERRVGRRLVARGR